MLTCLNCGKPLKGRVDKKYCDRHCRTNYHNERLKYLKDESIFQKIDKQLKRNRRILKYYNRAGKAVVRSEDLRKHGFNPNYFTHYWKNKKGQVYLFCYEFGFLSFQDHHGTSKYTLVKWKDYMGGPKHYH